MTGVRELIDQFQHNIDAAAAATEAAAATALKQEYQARIRPAYQAKYPTGDIPASLTVEVMLEHGKRVIDGFGGPGWVQVSMDVALHPLSCFRTFAIAHETGHAVTPQEFSRVGVQMPNPAGDELRFEKIADLIAMKLLMERFPRVAAEVMKNLPSIARDLGPAGQVRMGLVRLLGSGRPFGQLIGALANGVII